MTAIITMAIMTATTPTGMVQAIITVSILAIQMTTMAGAADKAIGRVTIMATMAAVIGVAAVDTAEATVAADMGVDTVAVDMAAGIINRKRI